MLTRTVSPRFVMISRWRLETTRERLWELLINPVKEQRMNEAIAAIEALDSIRAPVMRIRLEYLDSD